MEIVIVGGGYKFCVRKKLMYFLSTPIFGLIRSFICLFVCRRWTAVWPVTRRSRAGAYLRTNQSSTVATIQCTRWRTPLTLQRYHQRPREWRKTWIRRRRRGNGTRTSICFSRRAWWESSGKRWESSGASWLWRDLADCQQYLYINLHKGVIRKRGVSHNLLHICVYMMYVDMPALSIPPIHTIRHSLCTKVSPWGWGQRKPCCGDGTPLLRYGRSQPLYTT